MYVCMWVYMYACVCFSCVCMSVHVGLYVCVSDVRMGRK
jgi:hypothetical protein